MSFLRTSLALIGFAAALPVAADQQALQAHVTRVAESLVSHVPRAGQAPRVVVAERDAVIAGATAGRIEVSTGLLRRLQSDAQLAMILAYEQCRALPAESRRDRSSRGSSVGARVARAAAVGAATGAVVVGVNDAMGSASPVARGAVTGAAAASTGVAVSAAMGPRRRSNTGEQADDRAVRDGMRTLIAAGWDGAEALRAWDRLSAHPDAAEDGGYDDARANAKRRQAAAKVLGASGQRSSRHSGLRVGTDSYRANILAPSARMADGDSPPAR